MKSETVFNICDQAKERMEPVTIEGTSQAGSNAMSGMETFFRSFITKPWDARARFLRKSQRHAQGYQHLGDQEEEKFLQW